MKREEGTILKKIHSEQINNLKKTSRNVVTKFSGRPPAFVSNQKVKKVNLFPL
jgi:hypothetical protein